MDRNKLLNTYYRIIVEENLYSLERHLKFKLNNIFKEIEIEGKTLIDIGGGDGIYSIYAACRGAKSVTCLEPEEDGSYGDMNNNFMRLINKLNLSNVELKRVSFQEYNANDKKFDIVLMHNSINHLNENAVERIMIDEQARKSYQCLFRKLNRITKNNSKIIICDCSNENIFNVIGIKNIFASNIEWEKHQSPYTWAKLLAYSGFENPKISWNTPKQLGQWGKFLLGNRIASYFITSHFRLEMTRV